jgi:YidC/Oxa1 family membrane protein insertase
MFDPLFEGMAAVLAWLYEITGSYGWAIILLTLVVRVIVTPLTLKSTRSMMAMQKFQPEIKRLQAEFKEDRQRLNEEMMAFYKANNINPFGTCLPIIIQMPVFLVLWQVVKGITERGDGALFDPKYLSHSSSMYEALSQVTEMRFLGLDLARSSAQVISGDGLITALPYIGIILFVVGTAYYQQRQVAGRNPDAAMNPMQKNLMRIMPLMFGAFTFNVPAALGVYLMTSNVYQIGQQGYISRALYGMKRSKKNGAPDGETIEAKATEKPTPTPTPPPKSADKSASKNGSSGKAPDKRSNGARSRADGSGRVTKPASGRVTPRQSKDGSQRRSSGMPPRRVPFGDQQGSSGAGTEQVRRKRRK